PLLAIAMPTLKPLEDFIQRLLWDADPVIAYLETTPALMRISFGDFDVTLRLLRIGVLDGVGEQVDKREFQASHVDGQRRQGGRDANVHAARLSHLAELHRRLLHAA